MSEDTKSNISHLKFIFNRMVEMHCENPSVDYMLRFSKIIDQYERDTKALEQKQVVYEANVTLRNILDFVEEDPVYLEALRPTLKKLLVAIEKAPPLSG